MEKQTSTKIAIIIYIVYVAFCNSARVCRQWTSWIFLNCGGAGVWELRERGRSTAVIAAGRLRERDQLFSISLQM